MKARVFDPKFKYTPSFATNIGKRIRAEVRRLKKASTAKNAKVTQLAPKVIAKK